MAGNLTQQDYADAFGVTLEETGTGTAAEGAPAEGTGTPTEGAQAAQGAAQTAETGVGAPEEGTPAGGTQNEQGAAQATETGTGTQGEGTHQTSPMSAEERQRQAAARRAREQQAMEAASQARIDGVFATLFRGQVNPLTGKPILTEADYTAYTEARQQQERTEKLQKAGVDPTMIEQMVQKATMPMQTELQQTKLQLMEAKAAEVNRKAEAMLQQSVQNIAQLYDPAIKSVEDISAMPTAAQFNAYVQKGIGLEDAFYLANKRDIDARRAQAAYSRGTEAAASRGHLGNLPPAAGEVITVPQNVKAQYRAMCPDMTDAEIVKDYAAFLKETN